MGNDEQVWERMQSGKWRCPCCGNNHSGVFDLGFAAPAYWSGSSDPRPNSEAPGGTHFLSEDMCVVEGRDYFVRCVLEIPLRDVGGRFGYGVWSSLSKANYAAYIESFDSADQGSQGPWFGWLSNSLPGYPDTAGLPCDVHPRNDRQRPLIAVGDSSHPLAIEQREGISISRLFDIYALSGHDVRSG